MINCNLKICNKKSTPKNFEQNDEIRKSAFWLVYIVRNYLLKINGNNNFVFSFMQFLNFFYEHFEFMLTL